MFVPASRQLHPFSGGLIRGVETGKEPRSRGQKRDLEGGEQCGGGARGGTRPGCALVDGGPVGRGWGWGRPGGDAADKSFSLPPLPRARGALSHVAQSASPGKIICLVHSVTAVSRHLYVDLSLFVSGQTTPQSLILSCFQDKDTTLPSPTRAQLIEPRLASRSPGIHLQ